MPRPESLLRVLLVSHCLPPDNLGGVEFYTEHLAHGLLVAGHEVTVMTRRLAEGAASIEREIRPDGVEVRRICGPVFRGHGSGLLDGEIRALSRTVAREAAPELVHSTHLMHHSPYAIADWRLAGAAVVLSLLDAFPRCPRAHLFDTEGRACSGPRGGRECGVRCFAHESERRRRLWRARARHFERLLGRVDLLLAPSRFAVEHYRPLVPDPSRLRLLPLPLHEVPGRTSATPATTDGFEIAFVGALIPEKGCDVILDALALEAPPRTRLRIIGQSPDPAYRAAIVRRASEIRGLRLDVEPPFAPGTLSTRLGGAHVAVVPSRVDETFSLVAREVLQCGIPVLASRKGALPEVVRDAGNGYLFDPERPRELTDRMLEVAGNPVLRAQLVEGALATPYVRLDAHVAALEAEYRRALSSRRAVTLRERLSDAVRLPRPPRMARAT